MEAVREFAMLPGPELLWVRSWQEGPTISVTADDVRCWPFSVGSLLKLAAFLSSLNWPSEVRDLGGGISHVELLILYERWAGERLVVETSGAKYRRPGRPISVSSAPLSPAADIWKLCQHLEGMTRPLCHLPGGIGRLIPGRIGANHGRLRHLGWEKCNHGLTCRPRESSEDGVLGHLLCLLGYPAGSGAVLVEALSNSGIAQLLFLIRRPSWKFTGRGHVADILTAGDEDVCLVRLDPLVGAYLGDRAGFSSPRFKRVRLTKKTRPQLHMMWLHMCFVNLCLTNITHHFHEPSPVDS